jgi:16S rRNA (guanine527-N7)-methyltransferase
VFPPIEFVDILRKNAVLLKDGQMTTLQSYAELLSNWNTKINLISRRDQRNLWMSHILHSLTPLIALEFPKHLRVLDIGSGGGLPGIPMSIVHEGMEVTLLDSIRKKTTAVEQMIGVLGLSRAHVLTGRAEELGKSSSQAHRYDVVVARAVAPLADLVKWSRPFLGKRQAGPTTRRIGRMAGKTEFEFPYLLALKGGDLQQEIAETRLKVKDFPITEINLVFPGSEILDLVDKKLIIVEFP